MKAQDLEGLEQYEASAGGIYVRILHPMSKAVADGVGKPGQIFISPLDLILDTLAVRICVAKTVIENIKRSRDSQPEVLRSWAPGDEGYDFAKRAAAVRNQDEEGEGYRRRLEVGLLVTVDGIPYTAAMSLTGLSVGAFSRALPRVFHATAEAGGTALWSHEWLMTSSKSEGRRGASWVPSFALPKDAEILSEGELDDMCRAWKDSILTRRVEDPEEKKPEVNDAEIPF